MCVLQWKQNEQKKCFELSRAQIAEWIWIVEMKQEFKKKTKHIYPSSIASSE